MSAAGRVLPAPVKRGLWAGRRRARRTVRLLRFRYLADGAFVHINKTGGSSVQRALGYPFQHFTAVELRRRLGDRRWSERFTFSFVRNPWDRAVSLYGYRRSQGRLTVDGEDLDVAEWVRRAFVERDPRVVDEPMMFMTQWDWVSDEHGALAVDFVGRFESLPDDFRTVCERLGVRAQLPHAKASPRGDYRDVLDAASRSTIGEYFGPDIEAWGYRF